MTKIFFKLILFLISIHEIKTFKCGADDIKIKPKELTFNKTYYQKDDSESSGYKAITNPSNDDISTYYEHLTATTSTAFTLTYSFNLSDGTSVRLIVKFKVKRY